MELHLASMENVTCWAFRALCQNATDSYTGMLSLTNLIKRKNTWNEVDTYPIPNQRQWIQIATSKETECSKFLEKLEQELKEHPEKDNIYGIQLNCSCPSNNLINIGQGPALIKRSTKVISLLTTLLKQNKFKIGIKLRLGLNALEVKQRKIFTILSELENLHQIHPNLTNITIHFKHAQESSRSEYNYSLLNEIASYNLPLVLNGGITSPQDLNKLIQFISPENRKNIKGIMLGRQALKNPDCFIQFTNAKSSVHSNQEIKSQFTQLCNQHPPNSIYLETIKEKSPWAN
ncbi:MAG: tRNA-dihydrouridine synthase [Nanoarchaeota archaeon]